MNNVLIVDASSSDLRVMAGLLTKAGYDPVTAENFDAAKEEVAKLPPGAVVVTAMKFTRGTAKEFIKWLKADGYKFPVIAVVDNLNSLDAIEVMQGHGAVDVVQRLALDKQLVETVGKYARDMGSAVSVETTLIPRPSKEFRGIEREISRIANADANVIIFGENGLGKEQMAKEIYRRGNRTDKPLTVLEAGAVVPLLWATMTLLRATARCITVSAVISTKPPEAQSSSRISICSTSTSNRFCSTFFRKNIQM